MLHALGFVDLFPLLTSGVAALEERFGRGRRVLYPFRVPIVHRLNRPRPSWPVAELDQFPRGQVLVGMGAVEEEGGYHDDGTSLGTKRDFLRVRDIAHVRVGLGVEREMGARDEPEGRALGRQVVEVVEHPQKARRRAFEAKDRRAEWLAVGVH